MRAKETTVIEFNENIFHGNQVEIEGCGKVSIKVDFPKIYSNDFDPTITIEIEKSGETEKYVLCEGDSFTLDHSILAKVVKDITKNHVFPITFKMDGQEYKLNRTKQNKLILTK